MRKRAVAATPECAADEPLEPQQKRGAAQLRQMLLDRFTMGSMSGCDVAEICYLVTEAGGQGVSDLALSPDQASKHGHEHVRRRAGKIFPEPDVTYVSTPLYVKKEASRASEDVPIMLPSVLLRQFVEKPQVLEKSASMFGMIQNLPAYVEHPVVKMAKAEGVTSIVRPLALYWDGAQYSVHDSFTAFYATDILSEQKFPSFLLSRKLSNSWLF